MKKDIDLSRRDERETFIKPQKGEGIKNDRKDAR